MGAFPFMKCTHKSYSNKHKPYPHLFLCLFSSLTITSSLLASTRPPHAPATRASIPHRQINNARNAGVHPPRQINNARNASVHPPRQINDARNAGVHSPSPNQQRPQRGRPSTSPFMERGAERPGVRSNHRRKSASAPSRKNETFLDSLAQANYNIRVESWEWFLALD